MDNFDMVSNFSDHSEGIASNASSLSGLSYYENEFVELRHLVNPSKYPAPYIERSVTPKQHLTDFDYDEQIKNLSEQLHGSVKLAEAYKNKFDNVEKQVQLAFHDKIDKLLKNNRQLEEQLGNANAQIQRLIKTYNGRNHDDLLNEKFNLEKRCHELNGQKFLLQKELLSVKNENYEFELENRNLRISLSDTVIDNDAKNVCIKELKEKISKQHVEIQGLLKNNSTLKSQFDELSRELDHIRKAQEWYKEQLHNSQKDKQNIASEVLQSKTIINTQNDKIALLNVELGKFKIKCDQLELVALKEKEKLLKKFDIPYNSDKNIVPILTNAFNENEISKQYQDTLRELTEEISRIKLDIQEQNSNFDRVAKENAQLISNCVTLQKTVQQNELSIEKLENSKRDLLMELKLAKDKEQQKHGELLELKNEVNNLKIELTARNQEKETVEDSIRVVREQFSKFVNNHEKLKEEFYNKNKQMLQLQKEKQELFMSNNWTICELEKMKEKDIIIKSLKEKLLGYEQTNNGSSCEIKKLQEEIKKNQVLVEEKENVICEKDKEIQRYENVLSQYKILVTDYDKKIQDADELLVKHKEYTQRIQGEIKICNKKIKEKVETLTDYENHLTALQNEYQNNLERITNEKLVLLQENENIKKVVVTDNLRNNNFNVVDILSHIYELYKLENKSDDIKFNLKKNNAEFISSVVGKIEAYLQNSCNCKRSEENELKLIHKVKLDVNELENKIHSKTSEMWDKISSVCNRCEDCYRLLKDVKSNHFVHGNDKVRELKVLLQVKELEMKEKQKKYETNNRTLLRKVKEHMKGRNAAEKHNSYLQEMYNSLFEENNSLKLCIYSKNTEIDNHKAMVDHYKDTNDRLKQKVVKMDDNKCDNCEKMLDTKDKLENKINGLEICMKGLHEELYYKQALSEELNKQITNLQGANSELSNENNILVNKIEKQSQIINDTKEELQKERDTVEELNKKMFQDGNIYKETLSRKEELQKEMVERNEQIDFLSNEIQILTLSLHEKTESLMGMENNKKLMENNYMQMQRDSESTVKALKSHLQTLQNEINEIKKDKFFFQRLCNDLKFALKIHVDRNKALVEHVKILSKEKSEFNSLPNILPGDSESSKYNKEYISKLLECSKEPSENKCFTEIHQYLDTLRKEVASLQEQIIRKNLDSL